jgi:DNA repair exonuclease SbcCD ATPase subunit
LLEKKQLYDVATTLLKDTGVKTAIIHEYMPVINKLINKYLNSMDFYAQFELDDTFQEIIRSRNRDVFSYNSFSEGEKQKINLSILFTWRQIAKMKNSVNTNLLIMDEIFDGSIDGDSVELLSDILKEFTKTSNTNVFVISHRDIGNSDVFDHTIKFEKRNEFSVIA